MFSFYTSWSKTVVSELKVSSSIAVMVNSKRLLTTDHASNFSEVKQSLLFKISLTQTKNWKMTPINLVSSRVITTCCCSNWKAICVTLRTEDLRSIYNCYSPHLLFSLVNRCLSSSALGFKDDVTRISIHLNLSSSSMTITYDVLVLEQQVFIILSLKK